MSDKKEVILELNTTIGRFKIKMNWWLGKRDGGVIYSEVGMPPHFEGTPAPDNYTGHVFLADKRGSKEGVFIYIKKA